jgi:MFS family permease
VAIGGFAGGFLSLAGLLLVLGAGCSTQHPLGASIVSRAFANNGRRAALGTYNFSGDLGKMVVPVTLAAAAAAVGWHWSSMALGVFGVAASGAVAFLLRSPRAVESPAEPRRIVRTSGSFGVRDVRGFSILCCIGGIDGAVRGGFMTFLPFLLIGKGAATESIGVALALLFGGGAAGKLACGHLAERFGILRTVIATELVTGLAIFGCVALPLTAAFALLPLLGMALNGTSSVLYATVGDLVDPERQSRAFGLFYTVGIGSAAIAPFLCGMLSDAYGVDNALRVLSACIFTTLPLCAALAPSLHPQRSF